MSEDTDMSTVVVEMELPMELYQSLRAIGLDRPELSRRARFDLAVELFAEGRLALGIAAQLADVSTADFVAHVASRGVPAFEYSEEDLAVDLRTVRRLEGKPEA